MNRLVIIGNGFDLAHGLPTSYRDFIDDFWKTACDTKGLKAIKHNSDLVDIDCEFGGMYNTFDYEAIDNLKSYDELKKFVERNNQKSSGNFFINFKNNFFKKICELSSVHNWVDIENEYYRLLKVIAMHRSLNKSEKRDQTIDLNIDFEQVKNILEKYLSEKILSKYDFWDLSDTNDFLKFKEIIKPISVKDNNRNLFKEFSKIDHSDIEEQFEREIKENLWSNLYILNFNYTSTILKYLIDININENQEKIHIPIHGILNDKEEHKINFGFGDEMDEDYKLIENIDDNEYLRYFKSFQYLQNSNYKRLLNLIETGKFQVYIMGHSCGLSDRTLLNTIFEHNNCRSIKVFYHQKNDGSDNYTEITQNISRHFNKKKLMREKIVNKTLCQPLPQIQLPKKE